MTTDKTSMAANLEVRVPFLNREMIEMSARMPPRLKLRGLTRKYVLKRALEGVLPKEVIWRRKAGFGAPIRSWLRGALRPMINDLLSEETVKRRGIFRPEEVRRVIEANFSGREDYNLQVFQLLGLELWHQTLVDQQDKTLTITERPV
jgi:asparagine synthase (glutamine-hydrolysing)